ncbi:MAG TPA: hypothetical protein P5528_06720 [Steroidobacteraceae bacterium]|nr:hypothetical protein [Steroidobacteraceae bacterium]HRX89124.1 hypothetical protein [Steroidobacteraceae bacterium]
MTLCRKRLVSVLACSLLPALQLWAAGNAMAKSAGSQFGPTQRAPLHVALADGISIDEAVSRAERRYGARVVRAETIERDGRQIYVLRMLSDDGRVFVVRIAASNGAFL